MLMDTDSYCSNQVETCFVIIGNVFLTPYIYTKLAFQVLQLRDELDALEQIPLNWLPQL